MPLKAVVRLGIRVSPCSMCSTYVRSTYNTYTCTGEPSFGAPIWQSSRFLFHTPRCGLEAASCVLCLWISVWSETSVPSRARPTCTTRNDASFVGTMPPQYLYKDHSALVTLNESQKNTPPPPFFDIPPWGRNSTVEWQRFRFTDRPR